jgi:hypothetical protein
LGAVQERAASNYVLEKLSTHASHKWRGVFAELPDYVCQKHLSTMFFMSRYIQMKN